MSMYEAACLDLSSTYEAQVKQVVKLIRRNLRKGVGIVDFSDDGECETNEREFKNHGGLRLLDSEGTVIAYKIRAELLRKWCVPRRMAEAVIDWFIELGYMDERSDRYRGIQDHPRKVGNTKNRYRYFTFSPAEAKRRKTINAA